MAFDAFLGRSNQRLEIDIALIRPGFVSAHPILSDVEPQEIKPRLALMFVNSVGDMGFDGVELQSDLA